MINDTFYLNDKNLKKNKLRLRESIYNSNNCKNQYPEYIENVYKTSKSKYSNTKMSKEYEQAIHKRRYRNHYLYT